MGVDPPETGDRARSGEIRGRLGGAGSIPGLGDFLPDLRLLPWEKEGDRKVIAGRGERGGRGERSRPCLRRGVRWDPELKRAAQARVLF